MTPSERKFKKAYGKELISLAEQDLDAAKWLSRSTEVRPEITLFHVGQTIEKSMKAVLCHFEIPVPLTHDLLAVLQTLPSDQRPPDKDVLEDLVPFSTVRRYEESNFEIKPSEVKTAIESSQRILDWAIGIVRK